MTLQNKLRIGVIYGGQSAEHQISRISAAFVVKALLSAGYQVVPIGIGQDGSWYVQDSIAVDSDGRLELLTTTERRILAFHGEPNHESHKKPCFQEVISGIDVFFPVVHGTSGEDGCLQGFFELLGIPYVGCGVLASALCMDKELTKTRVNAFGVPVVKSLTIQAHQENDLGVEFLAHTEQQIGFPCFVKAASLGSSISVYKVHSAKELIPALKKAFAYDSKVLVESAIDAREIEVSILESLQDSSLPIVSIPGEIIPHHEFYSYDAKYKDPNGASLAIPAQLTQEQKTDVTQLALQVFKALGCEGMARIDFFLDKVTGNWFLNEVNTIPGFTAISMYPKLMEYSGFSAEKLVGQLVALAKKRYEKKQKLQRKQV